MKTSEVNNATVTVNNATVTVKENYVKPAMEVYEMELEGVIMGASGGIEDAGDNGGVGRSQSTGGGLPWEKYSNHHGL